MTTVVVAPPAPSITGRYERALTVLCAGLALCSVASLLAWVFGLGRFAMWFWLFSVPAMVVLAMIAIAVHRSARYPRLRTALVVGAVGGLVGTIGYDLFRVPFALFGLRLMAPIDSYGVLLLDAPSSSGWTGLAGWSFHFANGIGFGIAYACVALGRDWRWGVAWAMVLETATVLTPFADAYGLSGKWGLIAIAYAAHLAYGAPLGRMVQNHEQTRLHLAEISPRTASYALAALAIALVVWQRPFIESDRVRTGEAVAAGPSAVVENRRLSPLWLRVPEKGCAAIRNDDDVAYRLRGALGTPVLEPGVVTEVCFDDEGVHRLRTSSRPYSGGFVIVDEEAA